MVNPFALPLWLAGLAWLFVGREGRRYRALGWAYLVTLAVFMILHGKDYYVAPAYPMLFAAGSVVCEEWIARTRRTWPKPAFVAVLVIPARRSFGGVGIVSGHRLSDAGSLRDLSSF